MSDSVSRETPPPPAEAAGVFATRLPQAEAYAGWLADAGAVRGLIGPREVPRLWERHLLNCAVLTDLLSPGTSVCDIGSGAGLPGLVVAIRRPDLQVTLVEPLLRRTTFLTEVVEDLALENVEIVRGRADALHGEREFDVVTSRAVAPLGRLLAWSLPLCRPDGAVLAMKGSNAEQEIHEAAGVLSRWGALEPEVLHIPVDGVDVPTTVVRVVAPPRRQVGLSPARRPSRARHRKSRGR
jgi:16S rRNA (guanine527-N7)-methyltransferase